MKLDENLTENYRKKLDARKIASYKLHDAEEQLRKEAAVLLAHLLRETRLETRAYGNTWVLAPFDRGVELAIADLLKEATDYTRRSGNILLAFENGQIEASFSSGSFVLLLSTWGLPGSAADELKHSWNIDIDLSDVIREETKNAIREQEQELAQVTATLAQLKEAYAKMEKE